VDAASPPQIHRAHLGSPHRIRACRKPTDRFAGGLAPQPYRVDSRHIDSSFGHLPDEDLKQRAWAIFPTLAAWLLRDARNGKKWLFSLPFWADFLSRNAGIHGPDATVVILSYLYSTSEQTPDQIQEALAKHAPTIKDIAMTAAEQLLATGKLEGKLEGEAIALTEVLQAKFGVLSIGIRNRIDAADEPQLRRWIVRAAIGSSIDFVFADSRSA
jgi:hypothetical protein